MYGFQERTCITDDSYVFGTWPEGSYVPISPNNDRSFVCWTNCDGFVTTDPDDTISSASTEVPSKIH